MQDINRFMQLTKVSIELQNTGISIKASRVIEITGF
jgi:hypothetical protein